MIKVYSHATSKNQIPEAVLRNANRFTLAARAGKLIREALAPYLQSFRDPVIIQRMMKVLMQVLKSGNSQIGATPLMDGYLCLLNQFSFNRMADLYRAFGEWFVISIDRDAGEVTLDVPFFNPLYSFFKMNCGTHFRLICAVAELDFENNLFETVNLSGNLIRTDLNDDFTTIYQVQKIKAGSLLPFIAVVGIEFFSQRGKEIYPLRNASLTPLEIVLVDVKHWE